jgi:hypothetical protein
MPHKPGWKPSNAGKGRPKGIPNKATIAAREAIGAFVDKQSGRLDALLTAIEANDGPKASWQCIMDLIEYHVPKLARVEMTGKDGSELVPKEVRHIHMTGVAIPPPKDE